MADLEKVGFKCPEVLYQKLVNYRFQHRYPSMTAAILALLDDALSRPSSPPKRRGGRR